MKFFAAVSIALSLAETNGFLQPHISHSYNFDQGSAFISKSRLFHGPPQYEKIDCVLREAEVVGNKSVMLHIDTEASIDYKPGHVMALEIENVLTESSEKNNEDASNNGGWLRGPYTVSRSTENSFDILIKVVGDKSELFASSEPGTKLKFGAKLKVPILEGIEKESTERVVFISTGVGVGPFVGAIEDAMKDSDFPPIELYACYRTKDDIVYEEYLKEIAEKNPEKFLWKPIISSENGRISSVDNAKTICSSGNDSSLENTHFHLIGNGQMVKEWKEGLSKAGIPEEKVTIEMYFNGKAEVDESAVKTIAETISKNLSAVGAIVS